MKRLPSCLLVAGLTLILVACGGGGKASTPTPSPSPTPIPTLAPGVVPGPGVTDTEIRVGMTNDLAGAGGTPYGVVTTAVQAYLTKVDQEDGGVCGRVLLLVARDDQYNPEQALAQTRTLVEQDQVIAVVGGLNTSAHAAVADYLNDPNADGNKDDGVPDLFVSTGYSGWGDVVRWPWTIGFIPDYQSDARILMKYINENLGGKKVGILYQGDEFGGDYYYAVGQSLADPALLVSAQPHDPAAQEITPYITNFSEAGVEVVILATPPETTAKAISAAHALNYNPRFVLSYVNSPTQLAALIGGGAAPDQLAAGIQQLTGSVSTAYLFSAIQNDTDAALIEHERIMQTFAGPPVSTLTIYAQSLAELLVDALSRACHNLTRRGLWEAVQGVSGVHPSLFLPGINVNLSPEDHRSVQAMQLIEFREDGTVQPIGDPVSLE